MDIRSAQSDSYCRWYFETSVRRKRVRYFRKLVDIYKLIIDQKTITIFVQNSISRVPTNRSRQLDASVSAKSAVATPIVVDSSELAEEQKPQSLDSREAMIHPVWKYNLIL